MSAKHGLGVATITSAGVVLPHAMHSPLTASMGLGALLSYFFAAGLKNRQK
jgi:hypothetical protein